MMAERPCPGSPVHNILAPPDLSVLSTGTFRTRVLYASVVDLNRPVEIWNFCNMQYAPNTFDNLP